jgi:sirohydrochlorin ferrochelatase
MPTAIIIVDHGSRRLESNKMLEDVAALFAQRFAAAYPIVEPAHMELAEPSIATAYAAAVKRGATQVIVCPFFLGPGKHWTTDIPQLTAKAAREFPATRYHVSPPLGIDDLIVELLAKRATHCVNHGLSCDSCRGTIRSGDPAIAAKEVDSEPVPIICGKCPYQAAGIALPVACAK